MMVSRTGTLRGEPTYLRPGTVSEETRCETPSENRSFRELLELGAYLSRAQGYQVVTEDGKSVGTLARLRYDRHAEYPDELIVRRGMIRRTASLPFDAVQTVDREARLIRLH